MRTNAIIRIVIYAFLILLLGGLLVAGACLNLLTVNIGSNSGTVVINEAALDPGSIRNIEIDWATGGVEIRKGDTDQIIIKEFSSKETKHQMTYNIQGDTLELSYGSRVVIGIGKWSIPNKTLVITVPQDWVCGMLEIDGASLSIDIQDIAIGTIDLDGASCSLNFVGSVQEVEIDGASADIQLHCTVPPYAIEVDGASCELDITLPKDCGFQVQMDGLSCNFSSKLAYSKNGSTYCYGTQQCKVNVDGISCDVRIEETD